MLIIVKKETFEQQGEFIKTGKDSNLCQFIGEGINLQQLSDFNTSISLPILTSARIVGEQILIQGQKWSTLVSSSLLATLLKSTKVENHVNMEKSSALVYIQVGGRKILTNFDKDRENLCLVEKDIRGMHREAIGILTKINSVFDDTKQLNSLFGDPIDMKRFESCIGTEADFENLLAVKIGRIEHCMELMFSEKRKKRSSLLG